MAHVALEIHVYQVNLIIISDQFRDQFVCDSNETAKKTPPMSANRQ